MRLPNYLSSRKTFYVIGIALVFVMGYWAGVTKGYHQRINMQNLGATWQQEISGYKKTTPSFSLYEDVVNLLKDKYYGDIDYPDLLYGSIKGAVDSLGDHYTSFSTPAESKDFFTSLNGIYEGVGIEMDYVDDILTVVTPIDDSPAAKAGIKPKDQIIAIDGTSTMGLTLDEAVRLIQGLKGTKVVLAIQRADEDQLLEITITRDIVKIPSVKLLSSADGLAVVGIAKFSNDTEKLFSKLIGEMIKSGVKGIVLDLRNNPGGFLDVGVKIANEFIPDGMIVEERFKDGKVTPFYADGAGKLIKLPVVVLVNEGSASAAEIVAGALQDSGRATVVGEPTYGKGSVQEIEEMPDGSTLRITIAHWYTPRGRSISQAGIKPDILIEADQESDQDTQLDKALEILKKLIK
ncbi:MAG: S41 family peptidase [Patescibacteria group bacterium]|jgi:carboxyl-terminal processing protease